jgi:iron(III) transport system substrate-binding protein
MRAVYRRRIGRVIFLVAVLSGLIYISLLQSTDTTDKLVIYTSINQDHAIKAMAAFQKETGIDVTYVRLSSGEVLDRLREERLNPVASIWYGGPSDTFVQAKYEGILEPYISHNTKMIPSAYKDKDGYWTGIYFGSIAFASNRQWLDQIGLPIPTSWDDLLDIRYKGMIMMADPRSSGTAYTIISTLSQLWGEDEAVAYLQKLHTNIQSYPTIGNIPGRNAGMGEVGTSILFSHDVVKYYKEGFRDLIVSFPKEGTGYEIGAVGIIKNGPNPKEAEKFVDWALTKHAQEIGKHTGNYQLLTNEQAVQPPESFPFEQISVIAYDAEWAGLKRQYLIRRWTREVYDSTQFLYD